MPWTYRNIVLLPAECEGVFAILVNVYREIVSKKIDIPEFSSLIFRIFSFHGILMYISSKKIFSIFLRSKSILIKVNNLKKYGFDLGRIHNMNPQI